MSVSVGVCVNLKIECDRARGPMRSVARSLKVLCQPKEKQLACRSRNSASAVAPERRDRFTAAVECASVRRVTAMWDTCGGRRARCWL